MKPAIITTTFAALLMTTTAMAASGPIRSVKISSGGVAEIIRSSGIDASGAIEIAVPLTQVDDILKSLVVFSDKASVKDMSLAGPQPIEETFQPLPFSPEDMNSLPRILSAMKGSKVTLDGQSEIHTIIGVEAGDEDNKPAIVLMTASGELTRTTIGASTRVRFTDATAQKQIDDAVALLASAAADSMRTVRIQMTKTDAKEVNLSYVVAAPVWKPTYKLVVQADGKARLQAWAVLENASGEDWNDVSITLSSGRPVTLKQRLHERFWKSRDEVVAQEEPDIALKQDRARYEAAETSDGIVAMAAPAMADMAGAEQPASVEQSLAMSDFVLPGTFSVRNGDTLSVPIVDSVVDAEFVALVASSQKHPSAALLVSNTSGTTLPAGIVTVYDSDGGYVGDARFSDMADGSSMTAVFGTDLKVEQRPERHATETVTSVKLDDWRLVASKTTSIVSTWRVTAGDENRTVVVEDAIPPGFRIAAGQVVEETVSGVRLKAAVPARETATLTVRYESEDREEMVAATPDIDRIGVWISGTTSAEVKARLKEVLDATSELGRANAQLEQNDSRYASIEREQTRIRDNLSGIEDATLKGRWLQKMSALEDEIDALTTGRRELETNIERLRKKLGEKIQAF